MGRPLISVLAVAVTLTGCALLPPRGRESLSAANPDPQCTEAARLRGQDAAYNGMDDDTQRLIFAEAFKACQGTGVTIISAPARTLASRTQDVGAVTPPQTAAP